MEILYFLGKSCVLSENRIFRIYEHLTINLFYSPCYRQVKLEPLEPGSNPGKSCLLVEYRLPLAVSINEKGLLPHGFG